MWKQIFKGYWNLVGKMDNKRIAGQTPTQGVDALLDIAYHEEDGRDDAILDIYRPQTDGVLPVIFDIHGGGWLYGTKKINQHYGMYLASKGFVVVSLNYRLAPEVTIVEQVQDVFAALRFVEQNIGDYGGDPNNLFVTGDSAGGHLTLLTAFCQNDKKFANAFQIVPVGIPIRAIGLTCAAIDLEKYIQNNWLLPLGGYFKLFLGKGYKQSFLREFVSFNQYANHPALPPVYLSSSKQDFIGKHTLVFADLLKQHGRDFKLRFWNKQKDPKLPHVFNVTNPQYEESRVTNDEMCEYFRAHSDA